MTTLNLALAVFHYLRGKYEQLKTHKSKGHDASTSQPLKPSTELKSNDL
ncbi:MAG: hypothetical protein U1E94_00905 [Agitococcus sp.]